VDFTIRLVYGLVSFLNLTKKTPVKINIKAIKKEKVKDSPSNTPHPKATIGTRKLTELANTASVNWTSRKKIILAPKVPTRDKVIKALS